VIGTLLDLPSGTLDIIEHDNHHKAAPCCNSMLEKWLEVDVRASWNKLLKVIESLSDSFTGTRKFLYSISRILLLVVQFQYCVIDS